MRWWLERLNELQKERYWPLLIGAVFGAGGFCLTHYLSGEPASILAGVVVFAIVALGERWVQRTS